MQPIRIGISACLLGQNVRYDGGHALDHFLRDTLAQFVEYVSVCPEVECGFGVPRETLRLIGDPKRPRLVTTKTAVDHTQRMEAWAQKRADELAGEDLSGFIFKSGSPVERDGTRQGLRRKRCAPQGRVGHLCPYLHGTFPPQHPPRRKDASTTRSCGRTSSTASSLTGATGTSLRSGAPPAVS